MEKYMWHTVMPNTFQRQCVCHLLFSLKSATERPPSCYPSGGTLVLQFYIGHTRSGSSDSQHKDTHSPAIVFSHHILICTQESLLLTSTLEASRYLPHPADTLKPLWHWKKDVMLRKLCSKESTKTYLKRKKKGWGLSQTLAGGLWAVWH